MKKALYIVCISALLLPGLLWAHDGNENSHKGPNQAVRKYIKEQIMPVLIQKRQQFDRELTTEERTEIADCRAALKQLQSQHHDWKKGEEQGTGADNNYYSDKHDNPEFEQRKAIMQRLQVIADKHSNSLQDIKTQLEPAKTQWMNDINRLRGTAANTEKDEQAYGKQWHGGHGMIPFPGVHHMAAHFLLLPVTTTSTTGQGNGELKDDVLAPTETPAPVTKLNTFELMPNPAVNDVQLGNDLLPANNELKIIDLQGKEVMTLENVQAAQHLDISSLAGGTYLVQIKSGEQLVSKKIIVSK